MNNIILIANNGADGLRVIREFFEGAPFHRCILISIILLGVDADQRPGHAGEGSARAGQNQRTEGHSGGVVFDGRRP